jgi:hypothetical protein
VLIAGMTRIARLAKLADPRTINPDDAEAGVAAPTPIYAIPAPFIRRKLARPSH